MLPKWQRLEMQDVVAPSIHPDTRFGQVSITVSDPDRCLAYYQAIQGFNFHRRESDTARLELGRRKHTNF